MWYPLKVFSIFRRSKLNSKRAESSCVHVLSLFRQSPNLYFRRQLTVRLPATAKILILQGAELFPFIAQVNVYNND